MNVSYDLAYRYGLAMDWTWVNPTGENAMARAFFGPQSPQSSLVSWEKPSKIGAIPSFSTLW